MTRENYALIKEYMKSCMADSAHDREHVRRVLYNALEIAADMNDVDYDVLIAACLLHDIARREQQLDPAICHAQAGSEKAYVFLVKHGFDEAFAQQVRHCIITHRYRKTTPPQSIEAKILFDADKLDAVGATGIARTLMYKGAVSEPLYSLLDDGSVSDGKNDEVPSFFQEYIFKLQDLYDNFYTEKGRALALERQTAAKEFYSRLYNEVSASNNSGRALLDTLLK